MIQHKTATHNDLQWEQHKQQIKSNINTVLELTVPEATRGRDYIYYISHVSTLDSAVVTTQSQNMKKYTYNTTEHYQSKATISSLSKMTARLEMARGTTPHRQSLTPSPQNNRSNTKQ